MLNQKIENLLKSNKKYISEKNEILKAKVYEDAVNINKELIELLLSDGKVRETYFTEINGVLVFDKQGFLNFLESKDFLPDSYTAFKNKIGLTDRNGNYLSDNDDVVLSFPYKDCVLVGGQDKDDQKREEKMYNEILAIEEISTLFSPKVLTNIKRFGKISSQSVSQSVSQHNVTFSENDNLIIKGNNLIALASLLKRYEGKVKCIYIDPPYNTGNDSFGYNDRFNHSTWLVFMKNRLELAKKLLSDDGVITVQCDDREQAYLKVLMDEIFGRENFLNCVAVKMSESSGVKMNHAKNKFPKLKEYILIYVKPKFKGFIEIDKYKETKWDLENNIFIENLTMEQRNLLINLEMKKINSEEDEIIANDILKFSKKISLSEKIKTLSFENEEEKKEWLFKNSYRIIKTAGSSSLTTLVKKIKEIPNQDLAAAVSKKGVLFFYITDFNRKSKQPRLQVIFADSNIFKNPCDFWQDVKTTGAISDEGGVKFVNSKKPEKILYRLIKMITKPNDIILDFFLGSGTTAAVAHKMGRRYIGIEQMDYIENIAVKRLKKVIDGEQTGISKTVNWQGGGSFVYCELKENGQELINAIMSSDEKSIDEIKEKIFSDDRIVPYITKQELKKVDKDFFDLKFEEKKKVLIDLVDKNKLYVNYSDINNEEYDISKEEKQFNDSFYKDVK